MIAHRCSDCLNDLPRAARRFVVVVAGGTVTAEDGETFTFGAEEAVVCDGCVGWYQGDAIEVTADEVGL